jgi:citrate lyase gamma subunit
VRAQIDQLRQAAETAAEAIRTAPRNTDGLPPGWDHARYPYGPPRRWRPGDAVNMPDGAGNYPVWDTIRQRIWRTKAADELAERSTGTSRQADRLIALDPIKLLTDEELAGVARSGVMPEHVRAEIEHRRIPQRMGRLLVAAGLDASEAMELTKLGDPSNLEPTVKEWHAVVDQRAREINPNRNRELELSLDDRVEFPFGSASDEELAAIVDRLRQRGVDLSASEAGKALRDILQREKERRGAMAHWTVP